MPSVEENLSDPFQRLDGALSTCQALSCRDEQAFQSQFPWKAIDTTVETLTEVNMDDYYVLPYRRPELTYMRVSSAAPHPQIPPVTPVSELKSHTIDVVQWKAIQDALVAAYQVSAPTNPTESISTSKDFEKFWSSIWHYCHQFNRLIEGPDGLRRKLAVQSEVQLEGAEHDAAKNECKGILNEIVKQTDAQLNEFPKLLGQIAELQRGFGGKSETDVTIINPFQSLSDRFSKLPKQLDDLKITPGEPKGIETQVQEARKILLEQRQSWRDAISRSGGWVGQGDGGWAWYSSNSSQARELEPILKESRKKADQAEANLHWGTQMLRRTNGIRFVVEETIKDLNTIFSTIENVRRLLKAIKGEARQTYAFMDGGGHGDRYLKAMVETWHEIMPFVNNFIGINALQWKTDSTSLAQPEKDLLLEPSSYLVADTMTWDSLASAETFDQYLADLFHVFENITQWTDIRKAQSMQASARCLQTQQDAQYKAVAEAERDKALRADQARREEEARNTQHWIDRVMGRKPVVSRSSPWFTPW